MRIKKVSNVIATTGNIVDSLAGNSKTDAPTINAVNNALNDIAKPITLNFNEEYVYSTDLSYICFKIGKMVFVNINIISFKSLIPNGTVIISGLPLNIKKYDAYQLVGGRGASDDCARVVLNDTGGLQIHYGSPNKYGDSANKQYTCTFMYITSE
jgi:hypothetical protein